ncbi:hypothetical protein CYY_002512 [Polysphondylium violaceum]|uniref:PPM-type phosphatase domain-containing protein n=1 Tax=Polysphondylium violaceum TaxID=133409 RepID=A0A8J4PZZ3_9MYCE|nr:hypothetical protein CYY_002512 [Polysphondylium violaceum]
MVLLYKSNENGLDITYISYHMYILDTCVQYTVKISYKNISSIPISLKFENDSRYLGMLCYLESFKEGDATGGVFEGGTGRVYPLIRFKNNNDIVRIVEELSTNTNGAVEGLDEFETELLPNQTIHLTSKYLLHHLPSLERSNSVDNNKITLLLPKHTSAIAPFPAINVKITVDAEFSSPVKSTESPSHPSSIQSLTLVENCSQTVHHINSNSLLSDDFNLTFELESLEPSVAHLCTYGWLSNSSKVEPHHIISSLVHIGFKDDSSPSSSIIDSNNSNSNIENSFSLIRDQSEDLITSPESFIYKIDISNKNINNSNNNNSNNNSNSNNNNSNANVIIKYQNNQYPVTLQTPFLSTSTTLLHIFAALSKLKQLASSSNSDNDNDSTCINSLLNLVFIQGVASDNKADNNSSQLSQSLPSFKKDETKPTTTDSSNNNNNNNNFKESGELLSNLISSLPKKQAGLGAQSLTAPPSMGKDLSNPIADFVAARAAGSSSTGPKKKGPPPRLGGPGAGGTVGSSSNGVGAGDIRLQRLASYNKVNQMWNLSLSDFAERHTISMRELEPYAFDFALDHIKNNWWKKLNKVASFSEIQWIRKCILDIINSPRINITFVEKLNNAGSNTSGAVSDLSQLLQPPTTTTTTTTSATNTSSNLDESKAIDPIKLKWIVEEVLNSEKLTFQTIGQSNSSSASEWFSIDVSETKGGRPHMEDKHVIIEYPQHLYNGNNSSGNDDNQDEQYFFGVFDGHNGKIAAEFTKVNLPFEIYSQTKGNTISAKDSNALSIIDKAYKSTDKYFLEYAEREDKKAGTTVATVVLSRDHFIVSNLGDTEVVVSRNGVASALSTVHTPKNESERQRIESAGGSIIHYGTLRVNGVLSVSRSIGDKNLKEYIIPDPDSLIVNIDKSTQFLIMATDGLWELFTHQEIVDYIITGNFKPQSLPSTASSDLLNSGSFNNLESLIDNSSSNNNNTSSIPTSTSQENLNSSSSSVNANSNTISGKIIEEALRRNPKDNITIVIIFFKDNFQP